MLAASAVCLAIALALDIAGAGQRAAHGFGLAGLILLALSAFPAPRGRGTVSEHPHFGISHGLAVHLKALDHLPGRSAYERFNKAVAVKITNWVGSMTCAWVFCLLALLSLPAVLTQALHVRWFPSWLVAVGLIALVAWIAQTFLQLVLLSVIMVGQNVQQAASDARAAKTFEDAESANASLAVALDRLDESTEGGLKAVLDAVSAGLAATAGQDATVAADVKAARSSAEAAFAGVQALAALATAPPAGSAGTSGAKPGRSAL